MLDSLLEGNVQMAILWLIAVAISITIHEFAHAVSALAAGDDTAKLAGRITLNPIAHYDPVGSTLFLLFGFGWAKPVPVNPRNFRNPRWHDAMVAFWGPLSNMILAALLCLLIRFDLVPGRTLLAILVVLCIQLNLILAFFNLIPIAPLDGSHIMRSLLPLPLAQAYDFFMRQWGMFLLLFLIIVLPYLGISPLSWLVRIPANAFLRFFAGT